MTFPGGGQSVDAGAGSVADSFHEYVPHVSMGVGEGQAEEGTASKGVGHSPNERHMLGYTTGARSLEANVVHFSAEGVGGESCHGHRGGGGWFGVWGGGPAVVQFTGCRFVLEDSS